MEQSNNESKQKREVDDRGSFGRRGLIANSEGKTRNLLRKSKKRRQ